MVFLSSFKGSRGASFDGFDDPKTLPDPRLSQPRNSPPPRTPIISPTIQRRKYPLLLYSVAMVLPLVYTVTVPRRVTSPPFSRGSIQCRQTTVLYGVVRLQSSQIAPMIISTGSLVPSSPTDHRFRSPRIKLSTALPQYQGHTGTAKRECPNISIYKEQAYYTLYDTAGDTWSL